MICSYKTAEIIVQMPHFFEQMAQVASTAGLVFEPGQRRGVGAGSVTWQC